MTDQDISLALEQRTVVGKGLNKIRREGFVPAVVHDHGKPSLIVMADSLKLAKVYSEAGKHHPVQLTIGDRKDMAIIKDAHFNPVKRRLDHVVFQAIRQDEEVETEVPITLIGETPAVKVGLLLISNLTEVQIEALPKNLPDELQVDTSNMVEIGDRVTVADLIVPKGVKVLTEPEAVIASIEETKAQISEEEAAAEEGAEAAAETAESAETEQKEEE